VLVVEAEKTEPLPRRSATSEVRRLRNGFMTGGEGWLKDLGKMLITGGGLESTKWMGVGNHKVDPEALLFYAPLSS
jgi:hypothetical protein